MIKDYRQRYDECTPVAVCYYIYPRICHRVEGPFIIYNNGCHIAYSYMDMLHSDNSPATDEKGTHGFENEPYHYSNWYIYGVYLSDVYKNL